MRLFRNNLLVAFLALLPSMADASNRLIVSPEDSVDFNCAVRVNEGAVSFHFLGVMPSLQKDFSYDYYEGTRWVVYFGINNERDDSGLAGIEFGLSYYWMKGRKTKGTVQEMVNASEIVAYRHTSSGYMFPVQVGTGDTEAKVSGNNLILSLKLSSEALSIIDSLPQAFSFWILNPNEMPKKCLSDDPL